MRTRHTHSLTPDNLPVPLCPIKKSWIIEKPLPCARLSLFGHIGMFLPRIQRWQPIKYLLILVVFSVLVVHDCASKSQAGKRMKQTITLLPAQKRIYFMMKVPVVVSEHSQVSHAITSKDGWAPQYTHRFRIFNANARLDWASVTVPWVLARVASLKGYKALRVMASNSRPHAWLK